MARIRPGFRLRRGQNLADLTDPTAARGSLGLGSAAVRDMGEAAGNAMEVGAFGVGLKAGGTPSSVDDIDRKDLPAGMTLYIGGNTVGTLPDGFGVGMGLLMRGWGGMDDNNGDQSQLLVERSATTARLYTRTLNSDGTWNPWRATVMENRQITTGQGLSGGGTLGGDVNVWMEGGQLMTTANVLGVLGGAVDTSHLVNDAVTAAKVAADAVGGSQLRDNSINANKLTTSSGHDVWVRGRIANGTPDDVGTYALLRCVAGSSGPGTNRSGSDLRWAAAYGDNGNSPSGTWKCMGWNGSGNPDEETTLWLRIS